MLEKVPGTNYIATFSDGHLTTAISSITSPPPNQNPRGLRGPQWSLAT